jgi:hypothetical protein
MKKKAYILLSCIAPLAVLIAALFIANADVHSGMQQMIQYRYAFYSFVIVAMCIEIRVRMRFRLQRTRLFWVHLSCAVPFFLILGILAFFIMPFSVSIVEGALFIVVLCTGVVLYTRGLRKELFTKNSEKI